MKKNKKIDPYINELLNSYPNIASGRKNYSTHKKRITKTLKIIKKYFGIKTKDIRI